MAARIGGGMLEAQNISLYAGEKKLLDDLSATFHPGKVSVILGPNGAGKTTLLSCLSGLRRSDSGAVRMNGTLLSAMDPGERARQIGLLAQNPDLHWDLRVRELVALGRYPHFGRSSKIEDDRIIDCAMTATATSTLAARNVFGLSGGERARVLLARALAGEPKWLLADEPLAHLDPRYQLQLLDLMRARARGGTGLVLVLHDWTQAAHIADHVILMHAGRIFAQGPAERVLTPENIEAVYDISVSIIKLDGRLVLVPKV